MQYTNFDLTIDHQVAHLRSNRPQEYNSMNLAFWREFPHAINAIDENTKARVLVISVAGKHFCSDLDLAVFTSSALRRPKDAGHRNEHMRQLVLQLQAAISRVEKMRIPVLVAL